MRRRRYLRSMLTLCLALLLLTGCSRSPRVIYYTLNVTAAPEAAAPAPFSVALGPVSVPAMVDQPQLVVQTGANRVDILEIHLWAAPLTSEIPRIIVADLAVLLRSAQVSAYTQNAGVDADYRVQVDIQRFEMTPGEAATVEALWSVRRVGGDAPRKTGRTVVSEPAGVAGYEALVAAQSRALVAVSRDLAQALRAEAAPP